jgi:predicted RNA-binding Zn-ribbon protein involved in translation (DUF1610 family)
VSCKIEEGEKMSATANQPRVRARCTACGATGQMEERRIGRPRTCPKCGERATFERAEYAETPERVDAPDETPTDEHAPVRGPSDDNDADRVRCPSCGVDVRPRRGTGVGLTLVLGAFLITIAAVGTSAAFRGRPLSIGDAQYASPTEIDRVITSRASHEVAESETAAILTAAIIGAVVTAGIGLKRREPHCPVCREELL